MVRKVTRERRYLQTFEFPKDFMDARWSEVEEDIKEKGGDIQTIEYSSFMEYIEKKNYTLLDSEIAKLERQANESEHFVLHPFDKFKNIADGKYGIDGYRKGSKWYKDENQE